MLLGRLEVQVSWIPLKIGAKTAQFATVVAGRWVAARVAPQAGRLGVSWSNLAHLLHVWSLNFRCDGLATYLDP